MESLKLNTKGATPKPKTTTPNQLLAADKLAGHRFKSNALLKPENPYFSMPCHDMTTNDIITASRPIPENLAKKLMSGAHAIMAIIALGISRSALLDPVVRGVSFMKPCMATKV
mmetsp:Transcript_7864/g.14228  ORF Transcript_7864/g.14228 Transcript_7864/m.14228 type:complete len:114 (-) Transcript_7864:925-1266(-)